MACKGITSEFAFRTEGLTFQVGEEITSSRTHLKTSMLTFSMMELFSEVVACFLGWTFGLIVDVKPKA